MQFGNSRVEIFIGCLCADQFIQNAKPHTVAIQILQESLKLFKNFSVALQIKKL